LEVIPKRYESFLEPLPYHFRIDSSPYWEAIKTKIEIAT
jgi:hypothetical protein